MRLIEFDAQDAITKPENERKEHALQIVDIEEVRRLEAISRWERNYQALFGQKPDFSALVVPPKPKVIAQMRLVIVAAELLPLTRGKPIQGVHDALHRHFLCGQSVSALDSNSFKHKRRPSDGTYAIWVKDRLQPEDEFAWMSLHDLKRRGHNGITLLERLLLEGDVFLEKGKHLDTEGVTLCSGSEGQHSSSVYCDWSGGRLFVWSTSGGSSSERRRSRQVWE
jgi:hypothetical protein